MDISRKENCEIISDPAQQFCSTDVLIRKANLH